MDTAPLGQAPFRVSRMTLGAMMFSRKNTADEADAIIRDAIDHGVTLIDTADSYDQSESYVGRALAGGLRDRVLLATKVFIVHGEEARAPGIARNSAANIARAIDDSLAALRTDRIDLYQLHHPDPDTPLDETLEALGRAMRQGKVRAVGCSNHYAWQLALARERAAAHGWPVLQSVQCQYSLLQRTVETELAPCCRRLGVGTMIYSPLSQGLLTGKYRFQAPPPEGSRGSLTKYQPLLGPMLRDRRLFELIDRLRLIADAQGLELHQLALLWVLSRPWVSTVILGGSSVEQFRSAYAVAGRRLDDAVVAELDALTAERVHVPYLNQPFADAPGGDAGRAS